MTLLARRLEQLVPAFGAFAALLAGCAASLVRLILRQ
jgi:hypothetical protein